MEEHSFSIGAYRDVIDKNPEAPFQDLDDAALVAYINTSFKGRKLELSAWFQNSVWTGRVDYSGVRFAFEVGADLFLPSLVVSLLESVLEQEDVDWWLSECSRLHDSMSQ